MTKSPWGTYATTGTPLDYTPIDAPIIHVAPDIPERPSRLWGWVYATGALIVGVIIGQFI
ncbi:hypothetical protein SAMN03159496_04671 [Rhizobium sp. NFR07]|uniref:hypothetical protein n=1 Tax=Rhizobium sp. NFR07 TaxID=1566262 RepID=UPI0008F1DAA5|nr:hypothetical protein [Rhizobium sp. NFR07]SFB52614.1 hypothetical protein SAMN03159496_04671 [Rhizobium sp. NFR07]